MFLKAMKTYLRHRICNVIDIKELIASELLDFEGKYRNYEETHDFWELCFVRRGNITIQIENTPFPLKENQLILISPNKKHSYHSVEGNQNKVFVICFDSFSQALDAIAENIFTNEKTQQATMERIMEECRNTFRMNESEHLAVLDDPIFGGQQALLLQLEYLLICLVRSLSSEKSARIVFFNDENFRSELAKVIMRYLRENIHKKITLSDVCERFNYSRSYICKCFKEQTGESLITCLNRLKAQEAARLLTETDNSVTDIAMGLGFRETKYFDSVFKKHYALTPVQYREKAEKHKKQ